jgi:hypothetical protein
MKRLFAITTVLVLCSALFFVVASPAAEIHFDGKWYGKSYVFVYDGCPNSTPLMFISIGGGVTSLMGGVNWFGMICIILDPSTGAGFGNNGTAIVSKPNGDALYLNILSLTLNPDGSWIQSEEIVGGAGKFMGYTGTSDSNGFAELNPLTLTGDWKGTNEGDVTLP